MENTIVSHLLSVNRQFYQTFGFQFSEKRERLQPGVMRLIPAIPQDTKILDLGCGNGEFACELARRAYRGVYTGLDFSSKMLVEARKALDECLPAELEGRFRVQQADLSSPEWDTPLDAGAFDLVTAFAVLHHIPGERLRRQILSKVQRLLAPDGRFMFSVWQFLNSPRLAGRIQPWDKIGLTVEDVDPGDYLLDWRHGGTGVRYVHYFSSESLETLAKKTDYRVLDSFHSDGQGGRLGLYQIWTPAGCAGRAASYRT